LRYNRPTEVDILECPLTIPLLCCTLFNPWSQVATGFSVFLEPIRKSAVPQRGQRFSDRYVLLLADQLSEYDKGIKTMMRIRRIRIFSAAKIIGFLYAIVGLLTAALSMSALPLLLTNIPQLPDELFGRPITMVIGLGGLLILPLLYWIVGALAGVLMALIYNLAAGWFGGLEIEYE
jgi:hypothetical protein